YVCTDLAGHHVTLPVPGRGSCTIDEYGDPFDPMAGGGGRRHMNGVHKAMLGWVPSTNMRLVTSPGDHTISPVETLSTLPQLLQIPLSAGSGQSYFLDFRQRIGFDAFIPGPTEDGAVALIGNNIVNGVALRLGSGFFFPSDRTLLLDAMPN